MSDLRLVKRELCQLHFDGYPSTAQLIPACRVVAGDTTHPGLFRAAAYQWAKPVDWHPEDKYQPRYCLGPCRKRWPMKVRPRVAGFLFIYPKRMKKPRPLLVGAVCQRCGLATLTSRQSRDQMQRIVNNLLARACTPDTVH
jgi:hypothetical protein